MQLVLLNISDHYVRTKANGMASERDGVYGCLLGQQQGRDISISNSFELLLETTADGPQLNEAFLTKKLEQCKSCISLFPQIQAEAFRYSCSPGLILLSTARSSPQ